MQIQNTQGSATSALDLPRYRVGTVLFSRIHRETLVPSLEAYFRSTPGNNYVCVSNVHTTVESGRNARLRGIQNGSFLTIADGQPVILYGKLSGVRDIERIMGPDIMTQVFASPLTRERRHFFLGGSPQTLDLMNRNLLSRFPDLLVAGSYSPPFRDLSPQEEESIGERIRSARPDYLWVCLGAPKQEYWMESNHGKFPGVLLIGIGAGFAYHAGQLKRAPVWAQKIACEWVWRLAQDPGRLWKRYFKTNPIFAWMLLRRAFARVIGLRPPGLS